ncbi:hypothetical protein CMI48_00340 [Candidatus Pacearchaeota archaeon]|nr:hypothetical protein [Candidatus Pacearchaeota archaeon]
MLVVAILALPGYNYYKLYKRVEDYGSHPCCRNVLILGKISEVSKHIEKELSSNLLFPKNPGQGSDVSSKLRITPNWIIAKRFFDFYIIHVADLCWVYIKQTKHSVNLIPTGTTFSVVFNSKHIINAEVDGVGEDEGSSLINLINTLAPWAIYGFSEEIKEIWEQNPAELIQEVDQRFLEVQKILKREGGK